MTKFTLEIACDNEAFDPDLTGEVVRILRATADNLDYVTEDAGRVSDVNGNIVGAWIFTLD